MCPSNNFWIALLVLLAIQEAAALGLPASVPFLDDPALEVNVLGDLRIESDPGATITVAFGVRNALDRNRSFTASLLIPDGWSATTAGDEFEIAPNERSVRLINLRIPESFPPGSYRVVFTAVSVEGHADASAELTVVVKTYRGLSVSVTESPRLASASQPYKIEFLVHNIGNTTAISNLTLSSTPFAAQMKDDIITITANGRYPVSVIVKPESDILTQRASRVRLQAQHAEDATIQGRADALVAVIPDGGNVHSLRPRVDVNARVSSAGDLYQSGLQSEISGRVPLSGDDAHQAEFWLRTPSTTRTVLSQSDGYAFGYRGPNFWAKLGDHVFEVSPLTSVGRFGTGAGAGLSIGRVSARAHSRGARHAPATDQEVGASLSLDLSRAGSFSVNALSGNGLNEGFAGSLRYEAEPIKAISLDLEGGLSGRENFEFMYSAGARGRISETAYYVRAAHRGAEHPGQYYGYTSQIAGLSSRINENVSVALTLSNDATTAAQVASPIRRRRLISTAFTGESRYNTVIASGRLELRGESLEQLYDGTSSYSQMAQIRLRGGIGVRHLRFSTSFDVARLSNETGRKGVSSRIEFESSWSRDSHRIQASVIRETGPSLQLLQPSSYLSFRLGGTEQLTDRLKFRLDLMQSLIQAPTNLSTTTGWAGLEYRFADGKQITAETQLVVHEGSLMSTQANYRLTVEIPFNATNPIPMQGSLLSGIIIDEETGEGIPDVLVLIGDQSALSAEDGRFSLRRPASGSYHLMIDRVTLGLDTVPTVPMPMLIDVPPVGPTEFIRIPVTRRMGFNGEVGLFEIRGGAGSIGADTVSVGPADQVVVEISSGDIRHRRIVNGNGAFSFSDLPHGHWVVHVVRQSLPQGFASEEELYTIELPMRQPLHIRLISAPRSLRLLNGGTLENDLN